MATVLCVDDTEADRLLMEEILSEADHDVLLAEHVPEALQLLGDEDVDLVVSDYRMPKVSGLEFLHLLSREGHEVPVIIATAYATVEDAVSSIKAGAIDYITKPIRPEKLKFAVDQALELIRLRRENEHLRDEVAQIRSEQEIVGESDAIERVLQTISAVAPTKATVLIQGESGTGKELIARATHDMSDRSEGPFVAVNCAAMPENLVESLLFGHEKGAFTGATQRSKGAFERAHGGTLLLDEISEMRMDLQAKLLRALQEEEFERVGGSASINVDVRVIATTNRDLAQHVREGNFREDLYYRLNVVPIRVPPLRERKEDIPVLAHHFASEVKERSGAEVKGISPEALDLLEGYDWPGNVRELEHTVEQAVILSPEEVLQPESFDTERFGLTETGPGPGGERSLAVSESNGTPAGESMAGAAEDEDEPFIVLRTFDVREAESVLIEQALEFTDDNRTQAAELLGISPRTLRNKLNK
ncbi:MAG: sigma-54 dependent transcriptional regulator [Candidatus Palauibacterales bacterium]|nr:sigma-54 dependent transcriptional regulator [Candidatus Palauibacterales bacterium]